MQESSPDGQHMTDETFQRVLSFCREAQPLVVNVTGGEPTEHPKWLSYSQQLLTIPSVQVLSIITNGAWIEDPKQRIAMAKFVRGAKGRVKVQVYSNPKYYRDHEWTVEHEQQFRSIGCTPDFHSPLFMQDLGRARLNCQDEVKASRFVPSCINSHLMAVQASSLQHFFRMCISAAKFCRPLIDINGMVHMSESWRCPAVGNVADGADRVFREMRQSRPCKGCGLYKNFVELHPREAKLLTPTNPLTGETTIKNSEQR